MRPGAGYVNKSPPSVRCPTCGGAHFPTVRPGGALNLDCSGCRSARAARQSVVAMSGELDRELAVANKQKTFTRLVVLGTLAVIYYAVKEA